MKYKLPKFLALAALSVVLPALFNTHAASAATLTVAAGNDETTTNSSCSLSEAITNINDQAATYPDCAAGDGTNDTITLPAGTITLTADLPTISQPITIEGQGMGSSTVDGDMGQYTVFRTALGQAELFTIRGLKVQAFKGLAISTDSGDANISAVDIDASDAQVLSGLLFGITGFRVSDATITISNVYVHDADTNLAVGSAGGILVGATDGAHLTASISSTTVANIHNSGAGAAALGVVTGLIGNNVPGEVDLSVSNFTASNIVSDVSTASGIGLTSAAENGTSRITANIQNSTFSHLIGADSQYGPSSAIGLAGAAIGAGDQIINEVFAANNIMVDNELQNCTFLDLNASYGGLGTLTQSITSQGGNLSDDNSCSTYFTQSTDQNNVAALAASLLPLADNGGYVPTMALKEGSPAIDSGITIAGLTTDARGITRPQGTAYDSGAYESPYSKPATPTLAKSGENILVALGSALTLAGMGLLLIRKRAWRSTNPN